MPALVIPLKSSALAASLLFLSAFPALAMEGMMTGGWTGPVDHYCERIAPGVLGEPLNALINLLFVLAAGAAFSIALVFRMADQQLCGAWPHGTHVLWHSFNALSVGLGLVAIVRHVPRHR